MKINLVNNLNKAVDFVDKSISELDPIIASIAIAILSVAVWTLFNPITWTTVIGGAIIFVAIAALITPDNYFETTQNEPQAAPATKLTRGIPNTGNTCWLNATLKFIASSDYFDAMFDSANEQEPKELRKALGDVIRALRMNSTATLEMDLYMKLQEEINKSIKLPNTINIFDRTQRDASEFLVKLIQTLYPNPEASSMIEQFTVYTPTNSSFEKNPHISNPTWYLPIDLHNMTASTTFSDLIEKEDIVTVRAEESDEIGTFRRTHPFSKLPTHLMLSFNRFDGRGNKINDSVPLDCTKLIQLVESELDSHNKPVAKKNVWYKIEAIVVHEGNSNESGHYVCNVREGNRFFTHSDTCKPRPLTLNYSGTEGYFYHLVKVKEEIINHNNQ